MDDLIMAPFHLKVFEHSRARHTRARPRQGLRQLIIKAALVEAQLKREAIMAKAPYSQGRTRGTL